MGNLVTTKPVPDIPKEPDQSEHGAILAQARKRFREASDFWQPIYELGRDDLRFYWGDQWPADDRNARAQARRPCLELNQCTSIVAQITNEEKQSRPAISINPVGNGADVDTAQIIEGLCRHVEQISNAYQAYDNAFEHATIHGFGCFRLRTEYISPDSLDQEIVIDMIEDPFTVFLDPGSRRKDRRDARYGFIVYDLTKEQFEDEFPGKSPIGLMDFASSGDAHEGYYNTGVVRVVEYYWKEERQERSILLADATTWKPLNEIGLHEPIYLHPNSGKPMVKTITKPQVKWAKLSGADILEETDLPGDTIPIIPVWGRVKVIDGRRCVKGVIRDLKDAQRAYNFDRTSLVETNNLVPKSQWLATPEQIESYEQLYQQANIRNLSVLYYNAVKDGTGQPLPMPQRLTASPAIAHLVQAIQLDVQDLQQIPGIYKPQLGEAQTSSQSGKAILAVQRQGENSNFDFGDELKAAIELEARIMLDWIPFYYDAPRAQRIINPDNTHTVVNINQIIRRPDGTIELNAKGQPKIYDLTVGRYDVVATVAASFATRRKEFVESVLNLVQAAPNVAPYIMDLVVRNMDWPGAEEIADRIKKMLPPQLLDDPNSQEPIPANAKAQIQSLTQQVQQLGQMLQQSQQIIATKQVESEARLAIARMDNETKRTIADLNARVQLLMQSQKDGQAAVDALVARSYGATEHQLELIEAEAERDHAMELQQDQQQHEKDLQAQQGQQQQQLQQQAQQAQAEQAQQQQQQPQAKP